MTTVYLRFDYIVNCVENARSDVRLHGGVVVSTITSQEEGSGFKSQLGPLAVCVCEALLLTAPHPLAARTVTLR